MGMGKKLSDKFSISLSTFNEANDILGFDLMKLCFEGPQDDLKKTENTQPALLTAGVAAFRVYMQEIGLKPLFSAGHSLGEITALTCAGAIDFPDALRIVRQRGKFMQEAVPAGLGGMSAITGLDKGIIEKACLEASNNDETAVVSNYNSPEQIVISGHLKAINRAGDMLKEKGGRVVPLNVSAPFHCPLMQPAAENLKKELQKYVFHPFNWPVISNDTALPYSDPSVIIENLTNQVVKGVRWQASMEFLKNKGITDAIELGPQAVLKNLMKKNAPSIITYSFEKDEDIQEVRKVLTHNCAEPGKLEFLTRAMAISVCTRNSNWDSEAYKKGVIEPYKEVQRIAEDLETSHQEPSMEQMTLALEMLKSVFKTKGTPELEREERFKQLFSETGTIGFFKDVG